MVRLVLLRLLESYFRHRWLYLAPLVLMSLIAIGVVAISPVIYAAHGVMVVESKTLLANLTDTTSEFTARQSPAQTVIADFRELFQTKAFVRSAIQRTDLEANMSKGQDAIDQTIDYVRKSVAVTALGSKLVQFSASSEDPRLAQQMVTSSMESYVLWKINTDYQESQAAQAFFANLIPQYEEQVSKARDDLSVYLSNYPEPVRGARPTQEQVELDRLTASLDEATKRMDDVRAKEENARLAISKAESVARQTYLAIDVPELSSGPEVSISDMLKGSIIFVAIGFILSVAAVVGGALLDRSLRLPIDVRHSLHLPVLAAVPDATVAPAGLQTAKGSKQPTEASDSDSVAQQSLRTPLAQSSIE